MEKCGKRKEGGAMEKERKGEGNERGRNVKGKFCKGRKLKKIG